MNDLTSKSKLRDIAEDLTGTRPTERTLPNIVSYIEKNAEIVYEKEPHTFKGRLRELGYALNGVRPTQRSTRGIINNIVENYEGGGGTNKIYGVSGLTTESPYLTRTDDAVNMNWQKNIDGTVTSDFDKVFPYNKMERVTIESQEMVRIPSMWFRIGTDENNNITDIAVSGKRGEGDNWYQTKEFYYGAYCGSVTLTLDSKTNKTPTGGLTISQLRTYASANGEYYQQLDLYHKTIMNFLWWIEFANKNSDMLFPSKTSSKGTGATDSISTPTGFVDNRLKWHNIEDFFGNAMEFVEGISPDGTIGYATADPSKFNQGYKNWDKLNYSIGFYATPCVAKTLGWDEEHPFLCMPAQTIYDASYSTYFCDEYNNGDSTYTALQCGKYSGQSGNGGGVSSYIFRNPTATFNHVGARLLYCPNGV